TIGFSALRDKTAAFAYKTLIEENELNILCLQNIGSDLDKIKGFLGDDFDILSDGQDTAIAYSCRFTPIKSFLCKVKEGHKYTILTLKDRLTEKTYNVASAHISGFDLKNPMEGSSSAQDGDKELEELLSKLNEFEADGTIIGLNANTTKEHYRARLDLLEKAGFKTNDADRDATTYNEFLSDTPDKCRVKVDFIFTKKFSFIDFEKTNMTLEKPLINPSVHIPVIEQLEFDSSLLASTTEETSSSATTEDSKGPKEENDSSDTEQHLRSLERSLSKKGGTLKPSSPSSSSSKSFSLYSAPVELNEDPSSTSPSSTSDSEESGDEALGSSQDYLDTSASVIKQQDSPPPGSTSSLINDPEDSIAPPPASFSRGTPAEEKERLPALDTSEVEELQAALKATVVATTPEYIPDVHRGEDLEREEATAKAEAKAIAEAEAKAKIEKEKTEAEATAAAQAALSRSSLPPTRPLPEPPAAAKARTSISPASSEKTVAPRKPKSPLVGCMKKTAVVALVVFASITIPLVGSFYSFE
ncbi:MAG: hypothetical protein K1060chlam4_00868, partial [Candidatus Anoxychlamydiales bacterium]|nr:hypothetical protein [Candidatus Anoxychlamydiales bacterium]